MKSLRIDIDKVCCLSCKREEEGSLREIQRLPSGILQALVDPPLEWVLVKMDYLDRVTQLSTYKTAFVCSTCFQALPVFGQATVQVHVLTYGAEAST